MPTSRALVRSCIAVLVTLSLSACPSGSSSPAANNSQSTAPTCRSVSCSADSDCCDQWYCAEGRCAAKKAANAPCSSDNECALGTCGALDAGTSAASSGIAGAGGASTGKVCLYPCDTRGDMSCEDVNGYGTAFVCDGAFFRTAGACQACDASTYNVYQDAVQCDHHTGFGYSVPGYPCLTPGIAGCSIDRNQEITCKNGAWVVSRVCPGTSVCGNVTAGSSGCPGPDDCVGCND